VTLSKTNLKKQGSKILNQRNIKDGIVKNKSIKKMIKKIANKRIKTKFDIKIK
jgi:hypothetical protein